MVGRLPVVVYRGEKFFVDFRLGELRSVRMARSIKFVDLEGDKGSELKKRLRAVRFRTWRNEYIRGVDD